MSETSNTDPFSAWSYQRQKAKEEWLTPPALIAKLGEFNLDPCAPIVRPWDTAKKYYTVQDDGLVMPFLITIRRFLNS